MASLKLSVPEHHDYTDPTVELDPVRLQAWLADLPLMNIVETVRLVSSALAALNEQKVDLSLRFRCMEVYRPTILRLFETVDPLHIRQLSLSRNQRQETIAGASCLFNSLADGYKLVVLGSQGSAGTLTGNAINRAVDALGYVLLDRFRFYQEASPGPVAELHQLYRFARRQGLLDASLPNDEGQDGPDTSSLYKFSMLLLLADAERLAEGEISLMADVLREHAAKSMIVQSNSWSGDGAGLFVLDLLDGNPPAACSGLTSPVTAGDPYLLDIGKLLKSLRERQADIPERVRQSSPEAIILARISPVDRGAFMRSEQRRRDGRWISVVHGLENIHGFLLQSSDKHNTQNSIDVTDCRVLDVSEHGMKLLVQEGGAGDARVGDLFGIIEDEAGQAISRLALAHSLRVLQDGGFETGVKFVASGVGPVYCSVPDTPGAATLEALFLPAGEAEETGATLVMAGGVYAEGRIMVIDVDGREIRVRAGRLLSDNPIYDRFEFSAE